MIFFHQRIIRDNMFYTVFHIIFKMFNLGAVSIFIKICGFAVFFTVDIVILKLRLAVFIKKRFFAV